MLFFMSVSLVLLFSTLAIIFFISKSLSLLKLWLKKNCTSLKQRIQVKRLYNYSIEHVKKSTADKNFKRYDRDEIFLDIKCFADQLERGTRNVLNLIEENPNTRYPCKFSDYGEVTLTILLKKSVQITDYWISSAKKDQGLVPRK